MIRKSFRSKLMIFGWMMFALGAISLMCGTPAFAAKCGGAEVALLGCDDGEGGIWHILNLIIEIFSIGVGILGLVGILIMGIQILTAKDRPDSVKKAKVRLGQLVVGLVLYAVLFALLQWLLPGGLLNPSSGLQTAGSTTQVQEQAAKQEAAKQEAAKKEAEKKELSGGSSSDESGSSGGTASSETSEAKSAEIAKVAKELATKKNRDKYLAAVKSTGAGTQSSACKRIGKACGVFVSTVVRSTLGIKKFPTMSTTIYNYALKHPKTWKVISSEKGSPQLGDLVFEEGNGKGGHIGIVVKSGGKLKIAEASYPGTSADYGDCSSGSYPHISKYTKAASKDSPRYGRQTGYYIRYIGK